MKTVMKVLIEVVASLEDALIILQKNEERMLDDDKPEAAATIGKFIEELATIQTEIGKVRKAIETL